MSAGGGRRDFWSWAPLAAIVILGAWLRLAPAATAFLFGDEFHSLPTLRLRYAGVLRAYDGVGSGLALPLLQKACVHLFGDSLLSLRAPALVPGVLLLALLPLVGRGLVSPGGSALATALLATSSFHIFYSHFARSYALVALLGLLFVAAAARLVSDARPSPAAWVGFAISGALMPWAHLTSAPFVAGVGLLSLLALRGAAAAQRRGLLLAGGAGALGSLLLYWPVLDRASGFLLRKTDEQYAGDFSVLDVLRLLAGGDSALAAGLALLALGTLLVLRERGRAGAPLVAGALLPVPIVFLAHPYGDAYAYSRYAMAALPSAALLAGEALAWLGRGAWLGRSAWPGRGAWLDRHASSAALLVALGLVALGARARHREGPYANTYLSLEALPAFDAEYRGVPKCYGVMPAGASIVEAPALLNRSRLLYRAYFLQHRRPTRLGFLPDEGDAPPGPHDDVGPRLRGAADFLVLHTDAEAEVERYWQFVFEAAWPREGGSRALMERQRIWGRPLPVPDTALIGRLAASFGGPVCSDAAVQVFALR